MFKTIGDLNVHYDVQGTGYPMVLLHGGGSRAQTFEEMVPILAKSFQVYTFDMRGFGDTQRPAEPRLSHELWRDDLRFSRQFEPCASRSPGFASMSTRPRLPPGWRR